MTAQNNDPLYVLLRRAIDTLDLPESVEGVDQEALTSWRIFKSKVSKETGELFFLDKHYVNPLNFVVRQLKDRIAQVEAENADLRYRLERADAGPVKSRKAENFEWETYPDLEQRAFQMLFYEKYSPSDVIDFIVEAVPHAKYNSTFVNQRFIQNEPGKRIKIEVKPEGDSSPTSWAELWKIGCRAHAEGWMKRVLVHGGAWEKINRGGHLPKNWNTLNPNDFINAKGRKHLRFLYHTNGFKKAADELLDIIFEAGPDGISREDAIGKGGSGRRFDMANSSLIFQNDDGLWVHYSFAHLPQFDSPASKLAALKYATDTGEVAVVTRPGKPRKNTTEASTVA